jgi:hypothetical protein
MSNWKSVPVNYFKPVLASNTSQILTVVIKEISREEAGEGLIYRVGLFHAYCHNSLYGNQSFPPSPIRRPMDHSAVGAGW